MDIRNSAATLAPVQPLQRVKDAQASAQRSARTQTSAPPTPEAASESREQREPILRHLAEQRLVEDVTRHYRDSMQLRVRKALEAYDEQERFFRHEAESQVHAMLGVDYYV